MFRFDLVLVILFFRAGFSQGLVVNKCCPLGQSLATITYDCVASEDEDEEDLVWFPYETLLSTTLTHLEIDDANATIRWLRRLRVARFGVKPLCPTPHKFHSFDYDSFSVVISANSESGVYMYLHKPDDEDTLEDAWFVSLSSVCFDLMSDVPVLLYCPSNSVWLQKCCLPRQIYNATSKKCVPIPESLTSGDWKPSLDDRKYILRPGRMPACEFSGLARSTDVADRCRGFVSKTETSYYSNGSVKVKDRLHDPKKYCGEKTWHPGDHIIEDNYIVCGIVEDNKSERIAYSFFFFTGGVCLLVTVVISSILPELRKRTHNKIALTHNATLMVAYFAWGSSQVIDPAEGNKVLKCCFLSLLIQFTFLGSLFWLNAMCIDMSATFRTLLGRRNNRSDNMRYLIYGVYAWGLTAAISIFTMVMENLEDPPDFFPRPGLACYCGFARHTWSIFLYFYGPMALLLTFNLVLYLFTTFKIMSHYRQTSILHKTDSTATGRATSDKQKLIIYTKLFLLMGLTWMTEIIGWAVGGDNFFWFILDILNLLRAVFIFIIFVCKREVLRSLRELFQRMARSRVSWLKSKGQTLNTTTVQTNSNIYGGNKEWLEMKVHNYKETAI